MARAVREVRRGEREQRSKSAEEAREKISVTVERSAMEGVRGLTGNVSAFVNEAIKEKLYRTRLDAEERRLAAQGVKLDLKMYEWLLRKLLEAKLEKAKREA